MRHHVPDLQTQQQQQQSFLASIQQQASVKSPQPTAIMPSTSLIKHEEQQFSLITNDASQTVITKSASSISNCIISMNSNGQYQIKQSHPKFIQVKEPMKTMSPLIFSPSTTAMHHPPIISNGQQQTLHSKATNSSIQSELRVSLVNLCKFLISFVSVVGFCSQLPLGATTTDKLIIKSDSQVVPYGDITTTTTATSKQITGTYGGNSNLL